MTTNREGISRFFGKEEVSTSEFLTILKKFLPFIKKGKFSSTDSKAIDIVEKMDSTFLQIGLNHNKDFFIQTSNSPEITIQNYEQLLKSKVTEDIKHSFKSLLENKQLQSALKLVFKKYGPFKIDCELFPVLTHEGDGSGYIRFNATKYDREKMGTQGSLVLFKAWIKDENKNWIRPNHKEAYDIINKVKEASNDLWKIYTNSNLVIHKEIDLSDIKEALPSYLKTEKDIDETIKQLQLKKRAFNEKVKQDILPIKQLFQQKLDELANTQSSFFSKSEDFNPIEGVILRILDDDGKTIEIKGTSEMFQKVKEEAWKVRTEVSNLEKNLNTFILKDFLNIAYTEKQINEIISTASEEFKPTTSSLEKKEIEEEFLNYILLKLTNKANVQYDINFLKEKIFEIEKDLENIKINLENDTQIDPDTKRKSFDSILDLSPKIENIKNILSDDSISDTKKILNILREILSRKLEKRAGKFLFYSKPESENFSKYYENLIPVIVWIGRAQPWHFGHHQMIELAKSHFNKTGAQKVLIVLVKGSKSSTDIKTNPLTEKEQFDLLSSIYENDSQVKISENPIPTANIMFILQSMLENNCYIVGFLAGEDRIEDYKKMFSKFNAHLWVNDHDYLPIKVKEDGSSDILFIQTPRVMSGTEAREKVLQLSFDNWLNIVANGIPLSAKSVKQYKKVYEKIKSLNENDEIYKNIKIIFYGQKIILERAPLNKQQDKNNEDEDEKIEDIKDVEAQELSNKPKIEKFNDNVYELSQDKKSLVDIKTGKIVNLKFNKDGIAELNGKLVNLKREKDGSLKEITDDEIEDLGYNFKEEGESGEDFKGGGFDDADDEGEDFGDDEGGDEGEGKDKKGGKKEEKPNPETFVKDINLYLPKFTYIRDPELFKKIGKLLFKGLYSSFVWMMKAHNQRGGSFFEEFNSTMYEKYQDLVNYIKQGKISAKEAEQKLIQLKGEFIVKLQNYEEAKKKALEEFKKAGGTEAEFYNILKKRIPVLFSVNKEQLKIQLDKNKQQEDKKKKAKQNGEMLLNTLKKFIEDLEKDKNKKDFEKQIKAAREIYKAYEKTPEKLNEKILFNEFEKRKINPNIFVDYIKTVVKENKFDSKSMESFKQVQRNIKKNETGEDEEEEENL